MGGRMKASTGPKSDRLTGVVIEMEGVDGLTIEEFAAFGKFGHSLFGKDVHVSTDDRGRWCLRRVQSVAEFNGDPWSWLKSGDTGLSSQTIFSVLARCQLPRGGPRVPRDPADFGRCHRLLERMPEWRDRLKEVAAVHPVWTPFVAAWDDLTRLYVKESRKKIAPELYEALRRLNKEEG